MFNLTCIYSIIEANVVSQIINMKKFDYELLNMKENEVRELFGNADEIDNASFIYNKLLNSITFSNSSNEGSFEDFNDEIAHVEKIEKYLVDISSELFLFNYITKQFDKETLLQIPRIIFFPTLYNDKFENIFTIREEEINLKCSLLSFVGIWKLMELLNM